MIWNYVYEFFVKYIFGGFYNGLFYSTPIGTIFDSDGSAHAEGNLIDVFGVKTTNTLGQISYMTFPNYLSLIATIIVMALIIWFAIWLVIWVFKVVAHAFLLK